MKSEEDGFQMAATFVLPEPVHGYAQNSARSGEGVTLVVKEFCSSEDGASFISRLEGIPSMLLSRLPAEDRLKPSQIDRLLALIDQDWNVTLYLNSEVILQCTYTHKGKEVSTGDAVHQDNIADIRRIDFEGIVLPPEVGFLFLFSVGWRKGLYFDFQPLFPPYFPKREEDVGRTLAKVFSYVAFQDLFQLSADAWNALFGQRWFPFISLRNETRKKIITYASENWDIDELLESIAADTRERLPLMRETWEKKKVMAGHLPLLARAYDTYLSGDYISSASILYPRIEGVMRQLYPGSGRPSVRALLQTVLEAGTSGRHSHSLLLPDNFVHYLREVYFANFDPKNPNVFSRHSIAHGVAPAADFSLKAATIGFLILDQLSFSIPETVDQKPKSLQTKDAL